MKSNTFKWYFVAFVISVVSYVFYQQRETWLLSQAFWTVFIIDAVFDNNNVSFLDSLKSQLSQSLDTKLMSMYNPENTTMKVDEYYFSENVHNIPDTNTINTLTYSTMGKVIKKYRLAGKPVVIRSFIKHSTAMNSWNQHSWIKRFGDDRYEYGWRHHIDQFKGHVPNLTIAEGFEEQIRSANNIKPDKQQKLQLQFITDQIFRQHSQLLDEAGLDRLHRMSISEFDCPMISSILFWSYLSNFNKYHDMYEPQYSPEQNDIHYLKTLERNIPDNKRLKDLHSDGSDDFYLMVKGTKIWYIAEPQYSKYLKPWVTTSLVIRSFQNTNVSSQYVPHYIVQLFPGDLLYLPTYIWHSVTTLPSNNDSEHSNTSESIGIANRCLHRNLFNESTDVIIEYLAEHKYYNYEHSELRQTQGYNMSILEKVLQFQPVGELFIERWIKNLSQHERQQNATMKLKNNSFCKKKHPKGGYCFSTSDEVSRAFQQDYDKYNYYP